MHYNILQAVQSVYNKYKDYDYIDEDLSNYRIKSIKEFNSTKGGICWDFVGPIANDLTAMNIPWKCYFTGLHKNDEMIASHTYIITDSAPRYWIECAWFKHHGLHKVSSFKVVESLLQKDYSADEAHTLIYNPFDAYGKSVDQFFNYLEEYALEL